MGISKEDLQELLRLNPEISIDIPPRKDRFLPPVVVAASSQTAVKVVKTPNTDRWTQTEKDFARDYLQPKIESGEYLWFMAQVPVYVKGQRFTFDFVALRADGGADHFEVKGSFKLGSQDRASAKIRWVQAVLIPEEVHRVFWAKKGDDGRFKVKQIKTKKGKHPILK